VAVGVAVVDPLKNYSAVEVVVTNTLPIPPERQMPDRLSGPR